MNGIFVIDKPEGITSHDVVQAIRKKFNTSKVGHLGTLDPMATGVLPVSIGKATRIAQFLPNSPKEYEGEIRFGFATSTYDREGTPSTEQRRLEGNVEAAMQALTGFIDQVPPPFSAKKIGGVPAYKLARRRTPVQPAPVEVTVHGLTLEGYAEGLALVRVTASAGFYVRSLAHDVGQRLGCGAYLESLRRVRAGSYPETSATALADIEREGIAAGRWIVPLDQLLPEIPAVVLSERAVKRAEHGNEIAAEDSSVTGLYPSAKYRLLDSTGRLIAIAEARPGGLLHPVTVLV